MDKRTRVDIGGNEMVKKVEVVAEFEVTLYLEKGYEIKKVVNAKNEYEAVLEAADYIGADFELYWTSNDFEAKSVVRTNQEEMK